MIHLLGSNVDDELKELRRENSFLNNLVKRLVLDEVEQPPSGLGFRKQIAEKQPTVLKLSNKLGNYKFFSPTLEKTRYETKTDQQNNLLRRKLLEENLLDAVKKDPFLLARIQGLKNLQENLYEWK